MSNRRCADCPVAAHLECGEPANCKRVATGNPVWVRHVANRAKLAAGEGQDMPGIGVRLANFAKAGVRHLMTGAVASGEVKAQRLAICRSNECGFYRDGDRCGHSSCGCFLVIKTGWAEQKCPMDPPMWEAETKNAPAEG